MSLAVTKRKKSVIILAWIAPIVAIMISVAMVYDHFAKIGNSIDITLKNIDGLDLRQSHIQYNGLKIGDLNSIQIDQNDISQFIVTATIYTNYDYLIKEGTVFYKVSPEISLNEIRNLSNVLQGNYIEIIPPSKDIEKLKTLQNKVSFEAFDKKPKQTGITFVLTSDSGDFDITSAILYKGLQIGEIINKTLEKTDVNYEVLIYEKYRYLISSNTHFYKINPLEFEASLEEINLKIPSLKQMVSSGIGFINKSQTNNVEETNSIKDRYTLYNSKNEIEEKNIITNNHHFKIFANDITKNEDIYYKSIKVGSIDKIELQKDFNIVYGHINEKYKYLINNSTIFYKQKALTSDISLKGIKVAVSNLKSLLLGGVSFITPQKKEKLTNSTFTYYANIEEFYNKDKFFITLKLKNNHNIKKGSKLLYKNVHIGEVSNIELKNDIVLTLSVENKYKYLFGKNSKIYLKGLELSLDKIENLATTVFGDNLYLIADKNNNFKSNYIIDAINPDDTFYEKGLRIKLQAIESKNIAVGSPIYYKGFEVGEIYGADLTKNGEFIIFNLFIKQKYANIVQHTSKFYKATTVDIDVGVLGANIKLGSAKSMLKGGIVFINDKATATTTSIKDGALFHLLEKKN